MNERATAAIAMPQLPLVSVVMPAYNAARYIGAAIDSVLSQDYPNKELIVIDDGSTDDTVAVARAYGDRLRLIEQTNQGAAVARNAGLAVARGDFIAFLDADDYWLPGKLAAQVRHLQAHEHIGIVFSRWRVWKPAADGHFALPEIDARDDAAPPSIVPDRSGWLYNRLLFESCLHTITVMARRSLIARVGEFDPRLKRGQDYDYWIRASRIAEIHQLDRVFALYRIHGQGCVKKWPNENYELLVVEKALRQWGLTGPTGERTPTRDIRRRLATVRFDFGYHHFWEGDPRLALRSFAPALAYAPVWPALWKYVVLAALGSLSARALAALRNRKP